VGGGGQRQARWCRGRQDGAFKLSKV